jgi:hypothetical protein
MKCMERRESYHLAHDKAKERQLRLCESALESGPESRFSASESRLTCLAGRLHRKPPARIGLSD